jgi:fermentation-respiration switch protein FrsA (DUF1100 family)
MVSMRIAGLLCALLTTVALSAAALGQEAPGADVPGSAPPALESGDAAIPVAAAGQEEPPGVARVVYRIVVRVLIAIGVFAILAFAALLFFEDRFIFHPSSEPASSWRPEGLPVEQCFFRARDGVHLYGWWHPGLDSIDDSEKPVVLWCHGNAGNLTHREANFRSLVDAGLAVFIFDYRGYGQSEGSPSELGLYADVEAAYDYLVKERAAAPQNVVFFGRSLGAAAALHGALRRRSAGLIMEGAFENVPAMVRQTVRLPFLSLFVRTQFDNLLRMPMLRVPVLVMHGEHDAVVPYAQGEAVFAAAPEPKEFYSVPGAGHEDTWEADADGWHRAFADFCRRCVGGEMKRGGAKPAAEAGAPAGGE